MEGGFRKLWSRKKSLSSADQPSQPRRLSSSNGLSGKAQPLIAPVKDGRPSMASSRYGLEHTSSRDQQMTNTGDEYGRTKSGHRIQPMLVGISRPDTGGFRPDTAGSFQNAVQKAADSAARRPSDVQASQPLPTKSSQSIKSSQSRHVDIFAVSASIPSYLSRYNEEIAERNLDNYRLVLENTPYVYDPASKYQEEVAIRNAYLPYKSPSSSGNLQRLHERTTSATGRSVRSVVTPQQNGVHSHHPSADSTSYPQKTSFDQPTNHFRPPNQYSRDGPQTPVASRDRTDEDVFTANTSYKTVPQAPYSPPRSQAINPASRDTRMQTITEGQPYDMRLLSGVRTPTPRDSGHASDNGFSDYRISATEYGSRSGTNRSALGERGAELKSHVGGTFGPASTLSTASSTKKSIVLPNRTIMDLTNDDSEFYSETESSSIVGYSNYSPVLEQAKSDAFRKIQPSQIHTEERRGSKGPISLADFRENLNAAQLNGPSQVAPLEADIARYLPLSSTFSPINTVASWSPRSSAYIPNAPEPGSMMARAAAALEAGKTLKRESSPSVPFRQGQETSMVRERVASFENNTERTVSPSEPVVVAPSNGTHTKTAVESYTPAKQSVQTISNVTKTPATNAAMKLESTPSIYTSPESITSADYVNPGGAFGVLTRDFAVSPQESVQAQRSEIVPVASTKAQSSRPGSKAASKSKVAKVRAKSSTPAVAKPKEDQFDEEAFARKQAEARAALEKLQRSLSEDFITLPDKSAARNSKGKEKAKETDIEVRPIAPTLILPKEPRNSASTTSTQRTDTEKAPPSSFRNSRGSDQRVSLASNSRSLSTGSRSSRRAPAPSLLKNIEPATNPIDQNILSPALLHAMQTTSQPPKSPGEISLSSFPVPSSSRPPSQPDAPVGYHSHTNSVIGVMKRRNSTKSQGSTASAYSIPLHMVPGRTSSVRDPVPEEVDAIWA